MRRNCLLIIVALSLVVAVIFVLPTLSAQDAAETLGGSSRQWEYRVLNMSEVAGTGEDAEQIVATESKFNELGRDGWEFCQIHLKAVVFKRPRE